MAKAMRTSLALAARTRGFVGLEALAEGRMARLWARAERIGL